jgi:hypothetical protein
MPDLERCVPYNGKMYCWDKAKKKIAVINLTYLDFKDCPEGVIEALMDCGQEENDVE